MFSGIVETIGFITNITLADGCKHLAIAPATPFHDFTIGDSIAVNGICLTVTDFDSQQFQVTAVPETLRLTNLKTLKINDPVNLERSLKLDARIGGHYVQGHVDTIGEVIECSLDNSSALLLKIAHDEKWSRYIVNKGYITLDGMSITCIESTPRWFTITLIPHTQEVTISKHYKIGTLINIEVDILGKYVEKLIRGYVHAIPNTAS